MSLLRVTPAGLYCEQGGFFIDPHKPVDRAIITHAHADHCKKGSAHYLIASCGLPLFRLRLGKNANLSPLAYGESLQLNQVRVSLHPAGHILGSSQIRIESGGEIWVVTGDFKLGTDPTCTPFEQLSCHTLITESTFADPVYRWPEIRGVAEQINAWWRHNRDYGRSSLLYVYAVGKAQRILSMIDHSIGPLIGHEDVVKACEAYQDSGIELPTIFDLKNRPKQKNSDGLYLAPVQARLTPWNWKFGECSMAAASGWMLRRGETERLRVHRGFVVSDHADYPELMQNARSSGAERVYVTHGMIEQFVPELRKTGIAAFPLSVLDRNTK